MFTELCVNVIYLYQVESDKFTFWSEFEYFVYFLPAGVTFEKNKNKTQTSHRLNAPFIVKHLL